MRETRSGPATGYASGAGRGVGPDPSSPAGGSRAASGTGRTATGFGTANTATGFQSVITGGRYTSADKERDPSLPGLAYRSPDKELDRSLAYEANFTSRSPRAAEENSMRAYYADWIESSGYLDQMIGVESGGKANAKNKDSSATGPMQFIADTWVNEIAKQRPDLYRANSRAQLLEMRKDPTLVREIGKNFTLDNIEALRAEGIDITKGTVYAAHFLGADRDAKGNPGRKGAVAALTANPNTPIKNIVSSDAMSANSFLRGMTAGDFRAWAEGKMTPASDLGSGWSKNIGQAPLPTTRGISAPNEAPAPRARPSFEERYGLNRNTGSPMPGAISDQGLMRSAAATPPAYGQMPYDTRREAIAAAQEQKGNLTAAGAIRDGGRSPTNVSGRTAEMAPSTVPDPARFGRDAMGPLGQMSSPRAMEGMGAPSLGSTMPTPPTPQMRSARSMEGMGAPSLGSTFPMSAPQMRSPRSMEGGPGGMSLDPVAIPVEHRPAAPTAPAPVAPAEERGIAGAPAPHPPAEPGPAAVPPERQLAGAPPPAQEQQKKEKRTGGLLGTAIAAGIDIFVGNVPVVGQINTALGIAGAVGVGGGSLGERVVSDFLSGKSKSVSDTATFKGDGSTDQNYRYERFGARYLNRSRTDAGGFGGEPNPPPGQGGTPPGQGGTPPGLFWRPNLPTPGQKWGPPPDA